MMQKKWLTQSLANKWFSANGTNWFLASELNNRDSIILQTDKGEIQLESLRQQMKKAIGQPTYSLADFVRPEGSGEDHMGAFAVCIQGQEEHIDRFAADNDEYNKIHCPDIGGQVCRSICRMFTPTGTRKELLGLYRQDETLSNENLIRRRIQGDTPGPRLSCMSRSYRKIKIVFIIKRYRKYRY